MTIKPFGKVILLLVAILTFSLVLSAQTRQLDLSSSPNQALLSNNSDFGFDVQFQIGQVRINEITTKAGAFDELSIEGWGFTNDVGEPKLPMLRQMIAVPLGAEVRTTIQSQTGRLLDNLSSKLQHRIIPAQEPISKSADLATLPFVVNEDSYSRSEFNNRDWVQVTELGIMRGVRVFALDFYPVRYNPTGNSIRVMENFDVRVEFINPDLIGTADMLARTASWEFDSLYSQTLFNWNADTRTALVRYPTKMVILCPTAYTSNIQTYVDWKIQQGFLVNVVTVGSGAMVANTKAAINTYMQNLWNSATTGNPAPTYLLIIGDESGTIAVATNTGVTDTAHITDQTYVRLAGSDYMPEMYHGRFSVSSTIELANIINKTITYEKTLMPDLSYLGKTILIAGADGTYASTHGNGAINYGTAQYFNPSNGITSDNYLYPASQTSDAVILTKANEGRGYINYTAHGSETSWADPTFTVSNVNAMTNTNKYGVMVGNCCITNWFNYSSPCFGESIIRKANAGGVAYIGGINSTYWNEDYYWAVGYKTPINGTAPAYNASKLGANDAMFHTHGEATSNWATTTGEAMYMGNMAVQQSGSSLSNYYWEIYHIMGDPSLMTYMGVPTVNAATYPSQILIGATQITVTAAPYSRVALTMGGIIYGTAIVPANGSLSLPITAFNNVGTAKMTITAQNKITLQSDISIIPNSGPYVSVSNTVYKDTNNNVAEYNEAGRFNVTYKNVGSVAATNVVTTLTCTTAGITITDNSETIASLAAGASTTINNAYKFNIANNVPNGTSAAFTITMVRGSNNWVHNFTQTINAPALIFGNMTVSDPAPGNNNGRLDPGETVTITMPLNNTGAAASLAGSATLTSPTSGITINTGTASFVAIAAAGSSNLSFSITAAPSMTIGTVASLVFNATAGAYTATKTEITAVGLILEDFETGNFNSFPWIPSTIPWTIVTTGAHTGTYAAKSGTIAGNGSTTMETTRILSTPGNLSFWYKVSSESGYDKLKFYIDGTMQNEWSGTVDWTQASYPLTAGTRALKWEYKKDGSVNSGSDCAWVDDIIFPASTTPSSFYPPRNLTATPGNAYVNLAWDAPLTGTTTGYKIFRNSALLTTVTGLSYTDNTVVNETTYTYYLKAAYSANESDPTDNVTAMPTAIVPTTVIVGTGTDSGSTSTACPINVYYQSLHGQSVYTKAELNALGVVGPINISQIGFNVTGLPTKVMPNYIIRMGHTSATNVTSWISTGLTTVWTSASYQPTTTGWNMLTLPTPFLWNGTDNIVIDTAFGVIGSYNSSGTTQYSTVTNGYRYGRSDSVDQTNLFTGTYTSSNRPNLKLALLPNASGPMIVANPTTLDYSDVAVGTSSTQQFTILNGGNQTLTGSITTPIGYTVALSAARNEQPDIFTSKDSRNTLSFSINAGANKTYNLTLAPTAAIAYNGNVVISSNAVNNATVNIAVTGAGFIPPTIGIDNDALYANLLVGDEGTDSFTITNTGSQTLTYEISLAELRRSLGQSTLGTAKDYRSITGSTLTLDAVEYSPGTTQNLTFTVYNGSSDSEWLKDVIVTFPTGVTVNSVTNFVGGSGGDLVADNISGNGITIDWFGETSYNYGLIHGSETATATVNVSIDPSFGGTMSLPFQINGDVFGAEPHAVTGTLTVAQAIPPVAWLSVQPLSGSIAAGQSQLITGHFSAIGMAVGTYEAMLTIHSNDPVNPSMAVSATMDVWDNGNHAPIINLPATFAFDRNSILEASFSSYVTDEDLDPLTLGFSGNTNINIAINGLSVTFTAAQNWTGTETITFSVYDGFTYAYDSVQVTVNEVAGPGWIPVTYPNNSATVYGIVSIYGVAGQLNDVIGAFVGTECRGIADVVTLGGNPYVTLLVNLVSDGETVSFKIYDYSANVIYDALETYNLSFGQVLGTNASPVPISISTIVVLDPPVIDPITTIDETSGYAFTWQPVANATSYQIFRSLEGPYSGFVLIGTSTSPNFTDTMVYDHAFYMVKAVNNPITKGNSK